MTEKIISRGKCSGLPASAVPQSHGRNPVVRGLPKGLTLAAVLFLLMVPLVHGADVQVELKGIQNKIKKEKEGITKVRRKEGSVLKALEVIEKDLNRKNRKLKAISRRLDSILLGLKKTEAKLESADRTLQERRKLLKKRARALYKWQRGGSPFILLNGGGSVGDLMRRRRYLELVLAKDQGLLENLLKDSARQEALKIDLAVKKKHLDRERRALVKAKGEVRRERKKKRRILARLRGEKEIRTQALKELEQAAHRLQRMIDEIGRKSTVRSMEAYPWRGFGALRGKLDYPIEGKVVGGFGMTRHPEFSEHLFRKGIDIEAPLGKEIRTVERGRVVFADQFSGYGRMMIIDHGKRYYTIYAHLSELLKGPGETVRRGEPIALVGDSGSLEGARLYFEIRKDGKPLNPLIWFRKR